MKTDGLNILYLQNGPLLLELLQYQQDPEPARTTGLFDHLAFTVTDIHQEVQRLKSQGITFIFEEPRQVFGNQTIIFLMGPDGERIELVQQD
jgi:catechol 2,3-dioxygenase-like lactoylglutathione lyase family enzyme